MKYRDLKGMSKEDLNKKMSELKIEVMKEKTQIATGASPKNPGNFRNAKKTIAKIKQIMSEEKK